MTLNKRSLKKLSESMRVLFTDEQERIILERFGTEPEPYAWSEQDIAEQVRKISDGHYVHYEHSKHSELKPKDPQQMVNLALCNQKEQRAQVKVSVTPELASAFKAACAASNVSMASTLAQFMADFSNTAIKRKPQYTTRRQRRTAIKAMMRQLEHIKGAEERYMDAIPENLQGSVVFDNAEQSVSLLDEAIELLETIYC
jgi:hypothetical protein